MICFIILHYLSIVETNNCIDSINESLIGDCDYKIIVVDNASPNKSGKILENEYRNSGHVEVLMNYENQGYARGNNVGYKYAKDKYNPDYIVIANNDTELHDYKFTEKINIIYDRERFHILGPDIYSTSFETHQSPKRLLQYSLDEVRALSTLYEEVLRHPFKLKLKCVIKQIFFIRKTKYQMVRRKIDSNKIYYNVPLHGACVIFSRDYINMFDGAFYPNTFFYFEMEILDYICEKNKLKVVYDPSIQIIHHQNASTNIAYRNIYDKTIFSYKSNIESLQAYIKLVEGSK